MKRKNKIIGVDFDGTLATIEEPYPVIGEPILEIINYIKEEQEKRCIYNFSHNA